MKFQCFFVLAIVNYFSGLGADLHNIFIALLGAGAFGVWGLRLACILK